MRTLLVISEMAVGGAERVVAELARTLAAEGDAVALAAGAGPLDELVDGAGIERQTFPGQGRSPLVLLAAARAVRRAMTSFQPDVVHAHNVKLTGVTAVARASVRDRPPLLATFHGVPPGEYPNAARVLRGARIVACVSEDLVEGLARRGFPRERLRVVRNAVRVPGPPSPDGRAALDAELGLAGAPVVAIVGRLVSQKAHGRFLEAAALVLAQLPSTRFLVVGDGPLRRELEARAAAGGLSGAVRFTGIRDDVAALLSRADLVAFSSDWEGMPIVALEALAAATPVVTTDVEGMRELLAGDAGIVVERTPEALALGILELLRSPELRERMGSAGRERVEADYSVDAMVAAYRRLYTEIGARPRASR